MKKILLTMVASTAILSVVAAERACKYEAEWQELITELKKHDDCELSVPTTPSAGAAMQARSIAKALGWISEIKDAIMQLCVNSNTDSQEKILKKLKAIEYELRAVQETIGAVDDESVADLPSVEAIDQAQLTAIQWLKTIYRFMIEHQVVS